MHKECCYENNLKLRKIYHASLAFLVGFYFSLNRAFHFIFLFLLLALWAWDLHRMAKVLTELIKDSFCHCFWALVFSPPSTIPSTILWPFWAKEIHLHSYRSKSCSGVERNPASCKMCWQLCSLVGLRQSNTDISRVM